jgi:hypothetical protein
MIEDDWKLKVFKIDNRINNVRADMEITDRKIEVLLNLNQRRRKYLREFGHRRAEALNFEFHLEP